MSGLYGSKFADLWSGSSQETVRRVWAEKLGGFADMPKAIKEALDALDNKPFPPTLPEFLGMCREAARRHAQVVPALGYVPTAEDKARAEEVIQKAAKAVSADRRDHLEWAKRLKDRHEKGEKLSGAQIDAYREALGIVEERAAA